MIVNPWTPQTKSTVSSSCVSFVTFVHQQHTKISSLVWILTVSTMYLVFNTLLYMYLHGIDITCTIKMKLKDNWDILFLIKWIYWHLKVSRISVLQHSLKDKKSTHADYPDTLSKHLSIRVNITKPVSCNQCSWFGASYFHISIFKGFCFVCLLLSFQIIFLAFCLYGMMTVEIQTVNMGKNKEFDKQQSSLTGFKLGMFLLYVQV